MSYIFNIQRVTVPIVIFGGTAWIVVVKSLLEGLAYLVISLVLYVFLLLIEIIWIEHKHDRGIK